MPGPGVSDLDANAASTVAKEITRQGGQEASTTCGVTKDEDLERFVKEAIAPGATRTDALKSVLTDEIEEKDASPYPDQAPG